MHRIDTPNATADGLFQAGDPTTNTPPTYLSADWYNHVQEELANLVESTGEQLDKSRRDQVLIAIVEIANEAASQAANQAVANASLGYDEWDGGEL